MPGIIISRQGPVSYLVQTGRGNWKRHIDQLRGRVVPATSTNLPQKDDRGFEIDFELPAGENSNEQGRSEAYNQRGASQQPPPAPVQVPRYPLRSRSQLLRPPDYLRY